MVYKRVDVDLEAKLPHIELCRILPRKLKLKLKGNLKENIAFEGVI